jgi:hypothetical protein
MKKIVALFTAVAFALTLGVAFAEEKAPAAAANAPAAAEKAPAKTEKAPAKAKKTKKEKHVKKHKHEAAPATPGTATK